MIEVSNIGSRKLALSYKRAVFQMGHLRSTLTGYRHRYLGRRRFLAKAEFELTGVFNAPGAH